MAAQPARATLAAASSAMNDHRTLSPISEHPIPISKSRRAGSNSTLIANVTHRCPRRKTEWRVEAVGRDDRRRVDPVFVGEASI